MFFRSRRKHEKEAAARLYGACLQASRRPGLFLGFEVADTLEGRFEMLTLHLFAVIHRLMHVPGDDRELARLLSETFVDDMDAALRETGVSDVAVPRRMKKLYRSFAGRVSAYKGALEGADGELAAAIARNVYPDQQGRAAEELAAYVRAAVEAVRAADLDVLRRGTPPFPPAPHLGMMEATA